MFRKDLILRYGYLASLSLIPLSVIAQHEQRKNVCVCVCVCICIRVIVCLPRS